MSNRTTEPELSWPVKRIAPLLDGTWAVEMEGIPGLSKVTTEQLAAAGIPAEPHPPPPVTITVTVGDRSEVVELTDGEAVNWAANWDDPVGGGHPDDQVRRVGAALRRLGVQP